LKIEGTFLLVPVKSVELVTGLSFSQFQCFCNNALLHMAGDVGALGWWDLFINYG